MNTLQEFTAHHLYMRYAIDEHPDDRAFAMHMHEQCEIHEKAKLYRQLRFVFLFGMVHTLAFLRAILSEYIRSSAAFTMRSRS